jgi:hypothetical protein
MCGQDSTATSLLAYGSLGTFVPSKGIDNPPHLTTRRVERNDLEQIDGLKAAAHEPRWAAVGTALDTLECAQANRK